MRHYHTMKINLFYILIVVIVIAGGWNVYNIYFGSAGTPSAASLTAIIGSSPAAAVAAATGTQPLAATSTASSSTELVPSAPPAATVKSTAAAPTVTSAAVPTAPTGLSAITVTDTAIVLSWGASYDAAGVAGYKIFMNGKEIGTVASQKLEIQKLQASTTYTFAVSAYNQHGASSPQSTLFKVTTHAPQLANASTTATLTSSSTLATSSSTPDTIVPSTPTHLSASAVSTSEIDLSWTASTDNVGVAGYRIFSGSAFIATSSGTSYKSTGLLAGSTYPYAVAAYDAAGNASPQSASVGATTLSSTSSGNSNSNTNSNSNSTSTSNNTTSTADTTLPTTSITSPAANATVSGTVTVTASASDNVGVVKVEFYVDGALKSNDTSSPYTFSLDTTVLSNGGHALTTKAYDAVGNIGTSPAVSITVSNAAINATTTATSTATTALSAPTNLSATATSATQVSLTWSAPASAGIAGYRIYRDGHPLATNVGTSYSDTGLAASTTYTYTVAAYVGVIGGANYNESPPSANASATTPGN